MSTSKAKTADDKASTTARSADEKNERAQVKTQEVIAAKPDQKAAAKTAARPEDGGVRAAHPKDAPAKPVDEAAEKQDPPADEDGIERDPLSGAIVTGEDEHGNPLSTEDIARGAEPVTPGSNKDRHGDLVEDARG